MYIKKKTFKKIQFLSMWTCIHSPGVHTNATLTYADYAVV